MFELTLRIDSGLVWRRADRVDALINVALAVCEIISK